MPENFRIVIEKNMTAKELLERLTTFYENYSGKIFLPKEADISNIVNEQKYNSKSGIDFSDLNFDKIAPYFNDALTKVRISCKNRSSMDIFVHPKTPKYSDFLKEIRKIAKRKDFRLWASVEMTALGIEDYEKNKLSKTDIEKIWKDIFNAGLELTKAFEVEYSVGGWERSDYNYLERGDRQIQYICSKGNKYLDILQQYIKKFTNYKIEKEVLAFLVKKHSTYFKEKGAYRIVSFVPFMEEIYGSARFYEAIEKLKEEKK